MKEVIRLEAQDAQRLHKLMVDDWKISELGDRELYLKHPQGVAIGVLVDRSFLEQALCAWIEPDEIVTRAFYGAPSNATIDVLDMLCAVGSSCEPLVERHTLVIATRKLPDLEGAWKRSRLGRFATELTKQEILPGERPDDLTWTRYLQGKHVSEPTTIFQAKLKYPV